MGFASAISWLRRGAGRDDEVDTMTRRTCGFGDQFKFQIQKVSPYSCLFVAILQLCSKKGTSA